MKKNYSELIERLKKELEDSNYAVGYWQYEYDKAISRIVKAIEYIDSNDFIYDKQYVKKDKLVGILEGSDKE